MAVAVLVMYTGMESNKMAAAASMKAEKHTDMLVMVVD